MNTLYFISGAYLFLYNLAVAQADKLSGHVAGFFMRP